MIALPRARFAASLDSLPLAALLAAPSGAQESAARFDSPVVVAPANERIADLFDHLGVDDVSDFALADFDGDGLDDVVALLHSDTAQTFTIERYRNAGAGHPILADEENPPRCSPTRGVSSSPR